MKKTAFLLLITALNISLFSCTPQAAAEDMQIEKGKTCCGEDGHIPPPPPN